MPRAVDRARLVRQPTGRLSTFPGATVDEDDIPPLVAHDEPVTDHRQKARRFGVRLLAREVDVDGTLRAQRGDESSDQECNEPVAHMNADCCHPEGAKRPKDLLESN